MPVSDEIQRAFTSGATILTANVRAARWLQREYALQQRRAGKRAWTTPPIEEWDAWLERLWQTAVLASADAPLLLTSLQERSVWTGVQREEAMLLVSPASMAALAQEAYALLSDYGAQRERNFAWAKSDAESFRRWAASFDRECARRNWLPRAGLEGKVAAALKDELLPAEIFLVGFDHVTPAQDELLRGLVEKGVVVKLAGLGEAESRRSFACAEGCRDEITACALWARDAIEKNPEVRLGVLVPDLRAMRGEMERIFRPVLMPQSDDIFAAQAMPFEFSLGQPLAQVPVIRAALLLLRWLYAPLREEEVSWLLLSRFLPSAGAEYAALARLDAKRRASGSLSLEISLENLLEQREALQFEAVRRLRDMSRLAEDRQITQAEYQPGFWTDLVQQLLAKAAWPGSAERDTLHFQALRRWERVLDEIALLDFDGQRMSYEAFFSLLEAHALETIFAPESLGAPVQIMGALEASGQQFDAVWFLSVDDESWPLRGRAHPLLPNDVQQRYRMPYGNAASDLELAEAAIARIAASAPLVTFSYSERNKDGELRPSPLLPGDATWTRIEHAGILSSDINPLLEEIEEASGNLAWPVERSPGGSEVLKSQAACAFQAFAAKRLHARPLERSDWGLSAAQRGVLLHSVLEKIWRPGTGALHSLHELQSAIHEERLDGILIAAIADAFAPFDSVDEPWQRAYLATERDRLRLRLREWMEYEARRVPFEVIACEEELKDVDVGGLKLRLRADRIDQLENYDRLLIDYKTGEVSPRDWQPPRPDEPQVPLYAVFGNVDDVAGVLFASIRAGQMEFSGSLKDLNAQLFAAEKSTAALGKVTYTEQTQDEWQDALLTLAGDFLRGEAAVNPKYGKATCQYCPFPGLCRIAEVRSPLEEMEEAEGDSDA